MSDGKTFTTFANESRTLLDQNGIELREIISVKTCLTIRYELYMDGELLSKHNDLKTAKALWKDFSA